MRKATLFLLLREATLALDLVTTSNILSDFSKLNRADCLIEGLRMKWEPVRCLVTYYNNHNVKYSFLRSFVLDHFSTQFQKHFLVPWFVKISLFVVCTHFVTCRLSKLRVPKQESILPNFFLRKTKIFPIFCC